MPPAAAQPLRTGETNLVTEHTIFHTATVGKYKVRTGWDFHSSNDVVPHQQYCYVDISRTSSLWLAQDGKVLPTVDTDARTLGIDAGMAETLAKSCRWFAAELRDPTR